MKTIKTRYGVAIIVLVIFLIGGFFTLGKSSYTSTPNESPIVFDKVVLFSTADCGFCDKAKALLTEEKVDFIEMKIDSSPKSNALFRKIGGRGVPLLFIGNTRIEGYNSAAIIKSIERFKRN